MRYTYLKRDFSGGNPIANVLVIIAGVLVIGVAIVLGFFAFLALGAIVLVSAAVIGIRAWWLSRKLGAAAPTGPQASSAQSADVIEGEYRVVLKDSDET